MIGDSTQRSICIMCVDTACYIETILHSRTIRGPGLDVLTSAIIAFEEGNRERKALAVW